MTNTKVVSLGIADELKYLVSNCKLLGMTGIGLDTDFYGLPNLVIPLIDATELAESGRWVPIEYWPKWRLEFTDLKNQLDSHSNGYRPLSEGGRGDPPLFLWQPSPLACSFRTTRTATFTQKPACSYLDLLKAAVVYRLTKNLTARRNSLTVALAS